MKSKETLLFMTAIGLAASTGAATAADAAAANPKEQPAAAVHAQSLRAVRDKETGKLRAPTEDELKALLEDERTQRRARGQREPSVEPTPLVVRQHASGMRSAVLGPDFLENLKGTRRADGSVETSHADPAMEHPTNRPQRPTE